MPVLVKGAWLKDTCPAEARVVERFKSLAVNRAWERAPSAGVRRSSLVCYMPLAAKRASLPHGQRRADALPAREGIPQSTAWVTHALRVGT